MSSLQHFFGHQGPLAKAISDYAPRQAQLDMALAVEHAICAQQHLIAEAGTGTGKTFAYLVPAILAGKKIVVSTATKNLQDQLVHHDLVRLQKLSPTPFRVALLKGRGNYLCTFRLRNAMSSNLGFSREDAGALAKIYQWARHTKNGDRADMVALPENHPMWYYATSNTDNCLGSDCDDYEQCFLMKARKAAQESTIVVVNHYLLCADWSLRDSGFAELLPAADVIIIDEAHQLADIASNFLGVSVSAKQLSDLADEALAAYFEHASDNPALRPACEQLQSYLTQLRLAFGDAINKQPWTQLAQLPQADEAMTNVADALKALTAQLHVVSVKSKALELLFKRSDNMLSDYQALRLDDDSRWVRWYETHKKSVTFYRTPLNVAREFRGLMQMYAATWIFTSATLSVAHSFEHFAMTLGLHAISGQSWPSPFDYPKQSLFYHPKGLPQPSDADFTAQIVQLALPVLKASRGRAFFLFTSHRALQQAAHLLANQLPYPLLVQGSMPKGALLRQFKTSGHAVLLGTASFWEGVDVRGEALSCVIIDKLPFAAPDDPVLKARLEALTAQGKNAFMSHQVPSAVIALRQGVGRLIRDVSDRGVLMICDPRLLKAGYGHLFLDSLPPMRRTRLISEVEAFFRG